ncbi:hypothetical protein HPB52_017541 [Rhipicephalus sanguineus]|uniref:Uncharacterized protein n=1 Tax=Rhipicephalus sanguineus TaxID=34632 RepID=A0A9D4Q7U1_RHISA|nr:hypothetical protein HPB52_017541 [Rhipicephalus sanguineus]
MRACNFNVVPDRASAYYVIPSYANHTSPSRKHAAHGSFSSPEHGRDDDDDSQSRELSARRQLTTWAIWKAGLQEQFGEQLSIIQWQQKVTALTQKAGESLQQYTFAKLKSMSRCPIPITDKKRIEYLVQGIRDDQVATSIAVQRPRTVDDFLNVVSEVDRALDHARLIRSPQSTEKFAGQPCLNCAGLIFYSGGLIREKSVMGKTLGYGWIFDVIFSLECVLNGVSDLALLAAVSYFGGIYPYAFFNESALNATTAALVGKSSLLLLFSVYFGYLQIVLRDAMLADPFVAYANECDTTQSSLQPASSERPEESPGHHHDAASIPKEWGQPSQTSFRPRSEWSSSEDRCNPFAENKDERLAGVQVISSPRSSYPVDRWTSPIAAAPATRPTGTSHGKPTRRSALFRPFRPVCLRHRCQDLPRTNLRSYRYLCRQLFQRDHLCRRRHQQRRL